MERRVKQFLRFSFSLMLAISCLTFFRGTPINVKAIDLCYEADIRLVPSEGVYTIDSALDMYDLACIVNNDTFVDGSRVELATDVDMSDISERRWIPIGKSTNPFVGEFDGNGYTISNLAITKAIHYNQMHEGVFLMVSAGLFGSVLDSNISDVTLDSISIDLDADDISVVTDQMYFVGLLASATNETVISDVSINNSSVSLNNVVSGLGMSVFKVAGAVAYSNYTTMHNVDVKADVEINNTDRNIPLAVYVGGLSGNSHKTSISNSNFAGNIDVTTFHNDLYVGGLSGSNDFIDYPNGVAFEVDNTHHNNTVSGAITVDGITDENYDSYIGGLFGRGMNFASNYNLSTINLMTSSFSYHSNQGGLIGKADYVDIYRNKYEGTMNISENRYLYAGGLVGHLVSNSSIIESFSKGTLSSKSIAFVLGGLVGVLGDDREKRLIQEPESLLVRDVYSRMNISLTAHETAPDIDDPLYTGGLVGGSVSDIALIHKGYFAGTINEDVFEASTDVLINYLPNRVYDVSDEYVDVYYDKELTIEASEYSDGNTSSEMKTKTTFTNFDFSDVWVRTNYYNDGYPELRWGRYLVSFIPSNGTTIPDQLAFKATKPANPTKEGFDFIGWRTASSSENFVFDTPLSSDVELIGYYLTNLEVLVEGSTELEPEVSNLENAVDYSEEDRQQAILTKIVLTILDTFEPDEETLVNDYLATLDEEYENLLFIDISLFKVVGETETKVTTANEKLIITFVLPLEYREKEFIFMHIHDGVVKPIVYEYNVETFEVTFESQDFSSHVLAAEEDEETIVDTSDDPNYTPWIFLGAGAIVVGFSLIKRKPKEKKE